MGEQGMEAHRVAEIIVTGEDARNWRGSGYLVAAGVVLTAAHVVRGAVGTKVRFDADRPGERTVSGHVVWSESRIDVAVLSVAPAAGEPEVSRAEFGYVREWDGELSCSAAGFPLFKLRRDAVAAGERTTRYRDLHHAVGTCAPLSNRREGTLAVTFTAPGACPDPSDSPWQGMSGAAVWSGGRIIGVLGRHYRSDGPGTLAASRADRWAEQLGDGRLPELEDLLGVVLRPSALPDVSTAESRSGSGSLPTGGLRTLLVPSSPQQQADADEWSGGSELVVGSRSYLLHDALLEERYSPDHDLVHRQARALRLPPSNDARKRYAWVRQTSARSGTPATLAALREPEHERDLLVGLKTVRGMPQPVEFHKSRDGRTSTLVLAWPAAPSGGAPCESLREAFGEDAEPLDQWRLHRLFDGLSGLCATLAGLHTRGLSHRRLDPSAVVLLPDGRLALRDLGLAAGPSAYGEGPRHTQAPEQGRRRGGRPGPWTDVYQVAALAYVHATGRPPHPSSALPLKSQVPGLPERLCQAIDAGLSPDSAARPDIHGMRSALRTARTAPRRGAS